MIFDIETRAWLDLVREHLKELSEMDDKELWDNIGSNDTISLRFVVTKK